MAQLTLFFDRCFGSGFPIWLRKVTTPFGVEYHDERKAGANVHGFHDKTQDDDWLSVVGAKGWTVISHDKRFHKDTMASLAINQHNVACFYMDGGSLPPFDKMIVFARSYLRVREIIKTRKPPYIYRISHTGRVTLIKGGWP